MNSLQLRLIRFSISVYEHVRSITNDSLLSGIAGQLVRSSTSAGANYSEAQAASSRKDFHNKIRISLKEMKETQYWLTFLKEAQAAAAPLDSILKESEELTRILSTICKKTDLPGKLNS
jgi:four helix bundle protein